MNAIMDTTGTEARFDYTTLPDTVRADTLRAAERVRRLMRESVLEVGRELIAVKAALPHGAFGKWIAAEFGMSERSAVNYMAASKLAEKSATVAELRPTTIYALAKPSTPDEVRDRIIARLESGEAVSDAAVRSEIDAARKTRVVGTDATLDDEFERAGEMMLNVADRLALEWLSGTRAAAPGHTGEDWFAPVVAAHPALAHRSDEMRGLLAAALLAKTIAAVTRPGEKDAVLAMVATPDPKAVARLLRRRGRG